MWKEWEMERQLTQHVYSMWNITVTFVLFRFVPFMQNVLTIFRSVLFHSISIPFWLTGQENGFNYVHKTNRCVRMVVEWNDSRGCGTIYRRSPNASHKFVVFVQALDVQMLQQTAHLHYECMGHNPPTMCCLYGHRHHCLYSFEPPADAQLFIIILFIAEMT